MAPLGQGAVDAFHDRIAHPALSDIEIDWRGMRETDADPKDAAKSESGI